MAVFTIYNKLRCRVGRKRKKKHGSYDSMQYDDVDDGVPVLRNPKK
jgi:hypothetical protein